MRVLEANGATIQIPDRCECGETCSDERAAEHVIDWNKGGKKCSICGELIRVIAFTMKHYHKDSEEASRWSSADWAKYEEYWSWTHSDLYGRANVEVHVHCAREAMPYGNFEKIVYSMDRPEVISDEEMPKEISRGPCLMCGEVPTEADVRRVAARVFNFLGPCVYCGERIKLKRLTLFHGSLCGKHTGHWHFEDYEKEPILSWHGYRFDTKEHTHLEFSGHLPCAVKAMPHLEWWDINKEWFQKMAQESVVPT